MRPVALAAAGAAAVALAALARPAVPQHAAHDPQRLFRARCASCHVVPDPELRTDRAWIDQVRRTA